MTTTTRTPKVGETWTAVSGNQYTCVVDIPDSSGRFVWRNPKGTYYVTQSENLTPPTVLPPETFVNVYATSGSVSRPTRAAADISARSDRIAVLHLHPDGHITIDRLDGQGEQ